MARRRLSDLERRAEGVLGDAADPNQGSGDARLGSPQVRGGGVIRPGQRVRIRGLDQQGIVSSVPTAGGQIEVRIPLGKIRLPVETLVPEEGFHQEEVVSAIQVSKSIEETPTELNLIGCVAEEAARRLDRYVGEAFLAGLPTVRIIHGKGGGVLRRTVAELLQAHPLVASFRLADYREGGIGATIVELHSSGVHLGGAA
jgi:DNA mismatch repair protein MutS2